MRASPKRPSPGCAGRRASAARSRSLARSSTRTTWRLAAGSVATTPYSAPAVAERRRVDAREARLDDRVAEDAGDGVVRAQRLDLRLLELGAQGVRRALRAEVDLARQAGVLRLRAVARYDGRRGHQPIEASRRGRSTCPR
jgi:hypothetical protein